ncbi:DUF418 domain-containing protein [Luteibacter sp. CQ10]|uniref:DUF418 domain-containing protein n=1 Tax=Luteibacter sp. CQ10 TaxID=2805821 RepID=UPI0034A2747B
MTKARIPSLDVIRGVAILGVLAVNADGFAAPIHASLRPDAWMFGNDGPTALSYWLMDWLFHEKFVAIFSMLFGISLFLVGGNLSDRRKGINLARRLAALFVFAAIHGFGIWWGDILSTYACAGVVMFALRSLGPKVLLSVGTTIMLVTACHAWPDAPPVHAMAAPVASTDHGTRSHPHASPIVSAEIAEATASAGGAYALNTRTYVHQLQNLWRLLPRTIALMMIGLGLFKARFFTGALTRRTYVVVASAGIAALMALAPLTWHADVRSMPTRYDTFLSDLLSPLAALGYVALLILALRRGPSRWLTPFAAAGRMAFTNYLTQSLIMTSIFYGGRGALMGQVDRPALWAIVVGIWALQLAWSTWWLNRFEMGPLEWVWRWVTYAHRSPFVRRREALATPLA